MICPSIPKRCAGKENIITSMAVEISKTLCEFGWRNLTSYQKLLFAKLDGIINGLNCLQSEKTRDAFIFEGNLVNITKTFTDSVTLPLNNYSELVGIDLAIGSVELSVSIVFFPFNFLLQISHFSFVLSYRLEYLFNAWELIIQKVEFNFVRNVGYRNHIGKLGCCNIPYTFGKDPWWLPPHPQWVPLGGGAGASCTNASPQTCCGQAA